MRSAYLLAVKASYRSMYCEECEVWGQNTTQLAMPPCLTLEPSTAVQHKIPEMHDLALNSFVHNAVSVQSMQNADSQQPMRLCFMVELQQPDARFKT